MTDLTIAFGYSLLAAGFTPVEPSPIPEIAQELLDYVNSPAYQKEIEKEEAEINYWANFDNQ